MSKPRKVVRGKRIYRGRSKRPGQILRGILFALLLVVLIGIGYIVCREWVKYFGPGASQPESSAGTQTSSLPESSEESEPEAAAAVRGVTVSYETAQMTGEELDSYLSQLRAQGYTHVFVELKNEDGEVLFQTDAEQAVAFGSTDANAFDAAVFTAAAQKAGLTPGAFITALRDPLVSHVRNENSFAYADQLGTNWLDSTPALGGKSWLNPYMENARTYIAELAGDAAQKGFELIVLTDVNFPTRNTAHMNTIETEPSRNVILGQMLDEVQQAAGDVPVLNSIDLAQQLQAAGYECTQATISRDIMDMGLVKSREGYYVLPEEMRLQRMVSELVEEVHVAGNMVVVKTFSGGAAGVSAALDKASLRGALGTVAGDNTIMIAAETPEAAVEVERAIDRLRRR